MRDNRFFQFETRRRHLNNTNAVPRIHRLGTARAA